MSTADEPSFEQALEQLETIVGELERGEPELSEALAKYERGVRLLARCQKLLDGAERSVALLTGVDEAGEPITAPFDATATAEREAAPKPGAKRGRSKARPEPPSTLPDEVEDGLIPF